MAPYDKQTSQNYQNFQGINSKASPYTTGVEEVLDLRNLDFNTPGSLEQRPGFTQMTIGGVSGRVTGVYEQNQISGASYVVMGANTRLYWLNSNVPTQITSGLLDSALLDFQTFVDRLFFCNGQNFMKWQGGATPYLFSVLRGPTFGNNFGSPFQGTSAAVNSWGGTTFSISVGFINDRGVYGPPGDSRNVNVTFFGATNTTLNYNIQIWDGGNTYTGVTVISGSTITYFIMGASYGLGYGSTFPVLDPVQANVTLPIGYSFATKGAAIYRSFGGVSTRTRLYGGFYVDSISGVTYLPAETSIQANDLGDGIFEPTQLHFTLIPKYLELYNNQLFMGGFSQTPSTVWFSEIGEPETVEPEYNFEVRTNDGDRVTGLVQYISQLFIFKEKSFHALTGDDISNFAIRQISDQYGCISGRAMTTYENHLLFLDQKGIAQFNGANVAIISNKIEPVLQTMNLTAARDNAVMIHNRPRNQVWIGIPTNGSTTNNTTIIFDYLMQAWTVYDGFNPSSMAMVRSNFSQPSPVFGSYSTGALFNFSPSLLNDNGNGFTTYVKARFLTNQNESSQSQFRRLYLNVDTIAGSTSTMNINFFQDFGSSIVYSSTMPLTAFQTRIDFGISARTLSFEMSHLSTTEKLRLHGFVITSRFQRNV